MTAAQTGNNQTLKEPSFREGSAHGVTGQAAGPDTSSCWAVKGFQVLPADVQDVCRPSVSGAVSASAAPPSD